MILFTQHDKAAYASKLKKHTHTHRKKKEKKYLVFS